MDRAEGIASSRGEANERRALDQIFLLVLAADQSEQLHLSLVDYEIDQRPRRPCLAVEPLPRARAQLVIADLGRRGRLGTGLCLHQVAPADDPDKLAALH